MPSETLETQAGSNLVRLVRPSVVVLCGPAACGKSTFAERHFRPTQIISSDWARGRVCDDERDQRFNAQAFALVHFLVEQRLALNRLCVVDSTALTALARQELLSLAKKRQVPAVAMVFDVPLEACVERDLKRERSVGRAVIERQYQAFDQTKSAIRQEGFDQVLEIRDGDMGRVQIEIIFRPVARPPQRPSRPEAGNARRFERPSSPPAPRAGMPGGTPATPVRSPQVAPSPPPRPPSTQPAPPPSVKGPTVQPSAPANPSREPQAAPSPSVHPPDVSPTGGN